MSWTHCPECNCGPGDEHKATCSFWRKSRYYKETWKPSAGDQGALTINSIPLIKEDGKPLQAGDLVPGEIYYVPPECSETCEDRDCPYIHHGGWTFDDAGSLFDTREKAVWAFYKRSPQGDGNTP